MLLVVNPSAANADAPVRRNVPSFVFADAGRPHALLVVVCRRHVHNVLVEALALPTDRRASLPHHCALYFALEQLHVFLEGVRYPAVVAEVVELTHRVHAF